MHKRIAKITSTMLGFEDHGMFTAVIDVTYGGSGQGVGFLALGSRDTKATALSGEYIRRVLRAVGVDHWEKLKGRTVYVLTEDAKWASKVIGIENLPTEGGERFLFSELEG